MTPTLNHWDQEYKQKGIPSSQRDTASGVLLWMLANWSFLTNTERPCFAVDVGCGTGRNTLHLAQHGTPALGFDSSEVAIGLANSRLKVLETKSSLKFIRHDLKDGIPVEDCAADLVTDVFVYKHQTTSQLRKQYRAEIARVLRPEGRLLLSLAERRDGYYAQCPDLAEPNAIGRGIIDPVVGIGSVLFTYEELVAEMSDLFDIEMYWLKSKIGNMHGKPYLRKTMASIWMKRRAIADE